MLFRSLRQLIDELVFRGVLTRSNGSYPTLGLSVAARGFLRREAPWDAPFTLKVAQGSPRTTRSTGMPAREKTRAAVDISELDSAGQELYERLAQLRGELAREQGVPAYFIFNNATLVDLCAKRPRTTEELLGVSGVGAKKAERYGETFLELINA